MTKGNNRARTMLRLDNDLYRRSRAEAKRLGLSFNDFAILLIRQHFGEVSFSAPPTTIIATYSGTPGTT